MFNQMHALWLALFCAANALQTTDSSADHQAHLLPLTSLDISWYTTISLSTQHNHAIIARYQSMLYTTWISTSRRRTPIFKPTSLKSTLLYLSIAVICQSSDIELNPGPRQPKFPCGDCGKAVTWSRTRKSIACDDCTTWFHTDCLGMHTHIFDTLTTSQAEWLCTQCGMPNFSSSLFDTQSISLLDTASLTDSSMSSKNSSDFGSPIHASSPKKPTGQETLPKRKPHTLRVLQANIQSINAKKEVLWELIESTNPDIFVGCETWLKPNIQDAEILPPGYTVTRHDRADGYGGVLIMIKSDITFDHVPTNTPAELCAVLVETTKNTKALIVSVYRPPNRDPDSAASLCDAIRSIANAHPGVPLWVAGDFNLPDINWEDNSLRSH